MDKGEQINPLRDRCYRITYYPSSSYTESVPTVPLCGTSARGKDVIQRKVGLELELSVPVDKFTEQQREVMKISAASVLFYRNLLLIPFLPPELRHNTETLLQHFLSEFQSVYELSTTVDYQKEIYSKDNITVFTDHSFRVINDLEGFWPPLTAHNTIPEIITTPANNPSELETIVGECIDFVKTVEEKTKNLRSQWRNIGENNFNLGPLSFFYPGDVLPIDISQFNFDAYIQVNIGIDPARFDEVLEWYRGRKILISYLQTFPGQTVTKK